MNGPVNIIDVGCEQIILYINKQNKRFIINCMHKYKIPSVVINRRPHLPI